MKNVSIKCDVCRKSTEFPRGQNYSTGIGFLRISELTLKYRGWVCEGETHIESAIYLNENHNNDPDFCSITCMIKWVRQQYKELKKKHKQEVKEYEDGDC